MLHPLGIVLWLFSFLRGSARTTWTAPSQSAPASQHPVSQCWHRRTCTSLSFSQMLALIPALIPQEAGPSAPSLCPWFPALLLVPPLPLHIVHPAPCHLRVLAMHTRLGEHASTSPCHRLPLPSEQSLPSSFSHDHVAVSCRYPLSLHCFHCSVFCLLAEE